jgi:bifunctional ADP-heptose synthase (sugar kinase/adenylyltransferase)
LANYAGGIVVMKRGTATVSADELRRAVKSDPVVSGLSRTKARKRG